MCVGVKYFRVGKCSGRIGKKNQYTVKQCCLKGCDLKSTGGGFSIKKLDCS